MIKNLGYHIKGDTSKGYIFYLNQDINNKNIICNFYIDEYETILFTFNLSNSISILDYDNGVIEILKDVTLYWDYGLYYYDIKILTNNSTNTVINGTLQISNKILIDNENPNLFVPERQLNKKEKEIIEPCLENNCITSINYCDEPWIYKICSPYIVKQNTSNVLKFVIMQKKDLFGDNSYMDIMNYNIKAFVYNEYDKLIIVKNCVKKEKGFIELHLDNFDTFHKNNCYIYFELKKDNYEYLITNKDNRVDLIIN